LFAPVAVNIPDQPTLLASVAERMKARAGFAVATLNLDHVVKLGRLAGFRQAYQRHTHVVADGRPVVWLARLAGAPVSLVAGSDLVVPLCGVAARHGVALALLGTTPDSLARASQALTALHPDLRIVARISPAYGFSLDSSEFTRCIDAIRTSGAGLVLLALGAPKQEEFAARAIDLLPRVGFVSVGAALDFLSGAQTRAPWAFRAAGMEWFWRLASDPRRMTARYLACFAILPALVFKALKTRFKLALGN
jgi:exopolysaccharide biosynthesis WecB/TagA/CpsF family protein